jgi:hypothetical protein
VGVEEVWGSQVILQKRVYDLFVGLGMGGTGADKSAVGAMNRPLRMSVKLQLLYRDVSIVVSRRGNRKGCHYISPLK